MATYASLTQEQKDSLAAYTNLLRSWAGEQARTNNHADAINTQYNANVSAILSSVDDGEFIPNGSGLDGAISLVKADIISMTAHVQNVLGDMSSHTSGFNTAALRQLWAKACGAANLIG